MATQTLPLRLYRNQSRWALAEKFTQAQFVVTNSEFNRAFIERIVPSARAVPIHVVHEGPDLGRFITASKPACPSGPIRIISVGRLVEERGFEYLLRALALVRETGRSFRCVIVGGTDIVSPPAYEQTLRELRQELRLDDLVRFAGPLPFDQVLRHYAEADVFALPCVVARDGERDVTPNALLEAMAMKLAVVSSNITAIPEIVVNGVHGRLNPPRNPHALAQALIELIDDPARIAVLGTNARRRVEACFDIAKNATRYLELFA